MAVTVVGSVAFDALETPFGKREKILGGAATHFSIAASFFTDVRVVGVVGEDFGADELAVFERRGINTDDLDRIEGENSFFWAGRYEEDMSVAHTLETQLNVFGSFNPELSSPTRECDVLFLANIQPDLQRQVRAQCPKVRLVGLDSMNYWIESARESLLKTISEVNVIVFNDAEVRMLTKEPNMAKAAAAIRDMGPSVLLMKQGAYGACMYTESGFFSVPAYPLETVIDPTGAGDSFAGGFFGFLDSLGASSHTDNELRCAAVYGSVLASFAVEDFGSERMQRLTTSEIDARFEEFQHMTRFTPILNALAR